MPLHKGAKTLKPSDLVNQNELWNQTVIIRKLYYRAFQRNLNFRHCIIIYREIHKKHSFFTFPTFHFFHLFFRILPALLKTKPTIHSRRSNYISSRNFWHLSWLVYCFGSRERTFLRSQNTSHPLFSKFYNSSTKYPFITKPTSTDTPNHTLQNQTLTSTIRPTSFFSLFAISEVSHIAQIARGLSQILVTILQILFLTGRPRAIFEFLNIARGLPHILMPPYNKC